MRAIEALVGTRVQIGETFMGQLHNLLNLGTVDLNVKLLIFFLNSISFGNLKNDPCGLKYLYDTEIFKSTLVNPVFDYSTNSIAE
ncbi:hypothetical protein BpHYR1_025555 [Brachionus plicatilis]|uniref:Uncharacterized protein n=1 Tax=Brachionus plicatilis TaxID=10195 RepID=A0A3M7PK32_BRAPC|nr:hypothetical protein BpHYR1_025555 [Brachionus plicatilis]